MFHYNRTNGKGNGCSNVGMLHWQHSLHIRHSFCHRTRKRFQPQNDDLKFPFTIAHIDRHLLFFPYLVWILDYLSHVTGYYAIYYMAPKRLIQNVWGNLLHQVSLSNFDMQKFSWIGLLSIIVLVESCSTRITLGKLLNGHIRRYIAINLILNSFLIEIYGTCLFQLLFLP